MKLAPWNPRIDWNRPTKCEECGSVKFCRPLVDTWGEVVCCYTCVPGIRDLAEMGTAVKNGRNSVTEGKVFWNPDVRWGAVQGVSCHRHGAMSKVAPEIYRCTECNEGAWVSDS